MDSLCGIPGELLDVPELPDCFLPSHIRRLHQPHVKAGKLAYHGLPGQGYAVLPRFAMLLRHWAVSYPLAYKPTQKNHEQPSFCHAASLHADHLWDQW